MVKADDLEQIEELGRGAYGVVDKMRHVPSGVIMAVKVGVVMAVKVGVVMAVKVGVVMAVGLGVVMAVEVGFCCSGYLAL